MTMKNSKNKLPADGNPAQLSTRAVRLGTTLVFGIAFFCLLLYRGWSHGHIDWPELLFLVILTTVGMYFVSPVFNLLLEKVMNRTSRKRSGDAGL